MVLTLNDTLIDRYDKRQESIKKKKNLVDESILSEVESPRFADEYAIDNVGKSRNNNNP